jgi:hypothetical protein
MHNGGEEAGGCGARAPSPPMVGCGEGVCVWCVCGRGIIIFSLWPVLRSKR